MPAPAFQTPPGPVSAPPKGPKIKHPKQIRKNNVKNGTPPLTPIALRRALCISKARHSLELGSQGSSGSNRRSRDGSVVRGGKYQQSRHLPIKGSAWPPAFPQYQHLPASADKSNTSNPSTSFLNLSQTRFRHPKRAQRSKIRNKTKHKHKQ